MIKRVVLALYVSIAATVSGVASLAAAAPAAGAPHFSLLKDPATTQSFVADSVTDLLWTAEPVMATGWDQAVATCDAVRGFGLSSWRLPSGAELATTIDRRGALPPSTFPGPMPYTVVTGDRNGDTIYIFDTWGGRSLASDITAPWGLRRYIYCVHEQPQTGF